MKLPSTFPSVLRVPLVMGLTLSAMEGEKEAEDQPPDGQLSLL